MFDAQGTQDGGRARLPPDETILIQLWLAGATLQLPAVAKEIHHPSSRVLHHLIRQVELQG